MEEPRTQEEEAAVGETAAAGGPAGQAGTDGQAGGDPQAAPVTDPEAGAAPEAEAVDADLDELQARAAQRDEYLALAQRTQADFENYRRRMTREVAVAEGRGVRRLAQELLPALDNLDRALAAVPEDGHLAEGFRLVHAELVAALARVGIEGFVPKGEPFDPNEHEAMAQHPVEGAASGTVVEVYQPGYRLKDAVLRPARVVVAA
jgi:molecular chaperone GrpE